MTTIFTKIVNGELPCHKVAEDDKHLAFMEIAPIREGHTLVIPKKEVDYYFDLSDKELADLMVFAKKVAAAIKKSIPCKKVAVVVYGLQVPHTHVHLIPVDGMPGEIHFANAKKATDSELKATADKIKKNLN